MSQDNSPTYSELLSKKVELLSVIKGAPLDGEGAFNAFLAKLELMNVAKAMKLLEASMPF
jgi:hypothetical protein